jgi:hypothetical protein
MGESGQKSLEVRVDISVAKIDSSLTRLILLRRVAAKLRLTLFYGYERSAHAASFC